MLQIAIVYHSGFGHTAVQAQHVHLGTQLVSDVNAVLFSVDKITDDLEKLDNQDAIIFGSPTYMGSISAPFKAFMDASSAVWHAQKWKNKVAGGFTNSHSLSGDKLNTLIQMVVFATQHGMIWVGQSELNASPDGQPGKDSVINRVGSMLGAMAQSENSSPDTTPPSGDLKTAELLGERIATITKLLKNSN